MLYNRIIILSGFLSILVVFSGFPPSWKDFLVIAISIFIIALSVFVEHGRLTERNGVKRGNEVFVENAHG